MLTVLSPAKALDEHSPLPTAKHSLPRLVERARPLAAAMDRLGPAGIGSLLSLSPKLAELNAGRFRTWTVEHSPANSRPAVCTFAGDVYRALDAAGFSARDFAWAQGRLRILSGLYGLLRPLDLIQPYRLEMGTELAGLGNLAGSDAGPDAAPAENGPAGYRSLAGYWRGVVTDLLEDDLAGRRPRALLNLASPEYAAAVDTDRLTDEAGVNVVTPRFCDWSRGQYRVVGFFAKRARGAMAGWVVRRRVGTVKALSEFGELGYRHAPEMSTAQQPVYVRDVPDRPAGPA